MTTPFFPGRFQPFHRGHLLVLQGMVKTMGSPIIVLCDPLRPNTCDEDLFTLEERREILTEVLLHEGIVDATIVTCKDAHDDADWVTFLLDAGEKGRDIVVWSGSSLVRELCGRVGIATKTIVPVPGIQPEALRESLRLGTALWKKDVPEFLHEIFERILRTKGSDYGVQR